MEELNEKAENNFKSTEAPAAEPSAVEQSSAEESSSHSNGLAELNHIEEESETLGQKLLKEAHALLNVLLAVNNKVLPKKNE